MNELELKKLVKEFFENELSIYENDLKMRPLRDRQYEIKQILVWARRTIRSLYAKHS